MGARDEKQAATLQDSGIVVGGNKKRFKLNLRLAVIFLFAIILIVVLATGTAVLVHRHQQKAAAAAKKKAALVKVVSNPHGNLVDPGKLQSDSTSLINDDSVTGAQKAQAYGSRAAAESTQGQYEAAYEDYQKAIQTDPAYADGYSYPEFYAGYKAGKGKELIPLLQSMVTYNQQHPTDFSKANVSTYKGYITSLQNGQELPLP